MVLADILSQSEIDELLTALNAGEIDVNQIHSITNEKKVRTFDFRRPSKFAKDHLKALRMIHDHYARQVTNFLTGYLRTLVQVDVISVEPLAYNDFSNSISNPVILAVMDFSPLSGSILLEIDSSIAFALIDRILGGKGTTIESVREFTEIEIAIIERIVIQIINFLRESWEHVIPIRPRLERIETNPQFAQILSPNEMVALITFNTKVGQVEGMMNMCIPHIVVEPIVSKLSTKFWFSVVQKEPTEDSKEAIQRKIETTFVPLTVVLGRTYITVADFLELQKGDVLPLDTNVNNDLEMLVGDMKKFLVKPGIRKNRVAAKITKVIKKEEG